MLGRFEQHEELFRVGVLRFVENDVVVLRANRPGNRRLREEIRRERDLILKSEEARRGTECLIFPREA